MAHRLALAWLLIALAACFERGDGADERGARPSSAPSPDPSSSPTPSRTPGPASADREPEPGEADPAATLVVRLEAEPTHLNPLLTADAVAARVAADIYQGLLCPGPTGAPPVMCLADQVTVDPSGRIWVFHLRRARFHHGRDVEAADVLWSFGLIARGAPSPWRGELDDLRAMAGDGDRVVLAFARFRPARAESIARIPILPRERFVGVRLAELASAPENRTPSGTGPLRLVSWTGGVLALERWPDYWGPPARAARIEYHVIESRERAVLELVAGSLDVAAQLPVEEVKQAAAAHPELIAFDYPAPAYLAAVFNLRRPPLDDVRFRRALTLALDRPGIAKVVLGGAEVVSGPFAPGDPDADPAVRSLPFDPAAAVGLRPTDATRPTLHLLVPTGSHAMAQIADIWAADARALASLVVDQVPYGELLERGRGGRFDVALGAFTSGRELDLSGRFASAAIGEENWGGLRDGALDRLLAAARIEPDAAARRELRRAVHRRLTELLPYAFITADRRAGLARRGVEGTVSAAAGGGARQLWRRR